MTRVFGSPFRVHLFASLAVLSVTIWLASGTLSPYAVTMRPPLPSLPCHYLYNGDHNHFQATYWMLRGDPPASWSFSVVLRRILYPLLAYPFMKRLGFEYGGFLTNVLLHWAAFAAYGFYLRRSVGEHGAIVALWLLSTYPGIAYWVGLPYSYAVIVPFCLLLSLLLWEIEASTTVWRTLALGAAMGLLFTGYDFLPMFLPAAILVLAQQGRWRHAGTVALGALAPYVLSLVALKRLFKVPFLNTNSSIYLNVLGSYLHPSDLDLWWEHLRPFFAHLAANYFFSNFLFLPLLLLLLLALNRWGPRLPSSRQERAIALVVFALFAVNNLAPHYEGWQTRGYEWPRLYQPLFLVVIGFAARFVQHLSTDEPARPALARAALALCLAAVIGNGAIVYGPMFYSRFSAEMYYRFYHFERGPGSTSPEQMIVNLKFYGRRPLGFCRTDPLGPPPMDAGTSAASQ